MKGEYLMSTHVISVPIRRCYSDVEIKEIKRRQRGFGVTGKIICGTEIHEDAKILSDGLFPGRCCYCNKLLFKSCYETEYFRELVTKFDLEIKCTRCGIITWFNFI
jgi:hypothetical protein